MLSSEMLEEKTGTVGVSNEPMIPNVLQAADKQMKVSQVVLLVIINQ